MHFTFLLLGISSLASARIHRYRYGVLKDTGPEISHDAEVEIAGSQEVASPASKNSTVAIAATPSPTPSPTIPGLAEPCAIISASIAAIPLGVRKVVPADLGKQCLQSVPLDKDGNLRLLDELKLYLEWHSNLAYLKNPPEEYTEEPVDIMAELGNMQQRLKAGSEWRNEYDFQMELVSVFNRAYDNHLSWQPDILGAAMQFQTAPGTELVSVSRDGRARPEVFAFRDMEVVKREPDFEPSPVRRINGQGVQEYLQTIAVQAGFHDADARYNALFPNQAITASGVTFLGSFRAGNYQGPNTTLEFANGTVLMEMNVAAIFGDFTGVDSGKAFFEEFCNGPVTEEGTATIAAAPTTTENTIHTPSQTGYPDAVVVHPNLSLGGYFLGGARYEDVAVLAIPSYDSPDVNLFQSLMRDFFRIAMEANKTKLIVDLRGNSGGNAILGYDTFKQLFPQAEHEPFGGTRFRIHDALEEIGWMTAEFIANATYAQSNETAFVQNFDGTTENDILLFTSPFNSDLQLTSSYLPFPSWREMASPQSLNGDQYTQLMRYNLSDATSYACPDFSVTGYINNTQPPTAPPFKPENIIMLHDGMCSSTCALISELLKTQSGMRTLVIGGQPTPGPMQPIGGTKGAQSFEWDDIQIRAQMSYYLGSPSQQHLWDNTALGKTAFATQIFRRSAYVGSRPVGGVNLRDNLRQGDASGTPLEFMYEAADCRMFYTAAMVGDVTEVWKGAVDRMLTGDRGLELCVDGSTGHPSSVTGGGQGRGGQVPPLRGEGEGTGTGTGTLQRSRGVKGTSNAVGGNIAVAVTIALVLAVGW